MLFTKHILVETTNTVTARKIEEFRLAQGIITFVSVLFPKGCHGLVSCAIYDHAKQIFPSEEGQYLIGDGDQVEWVEFYELERPPHVVRVEAWGTSLIYDHVVTIRIAVLPRKAIVALALIDAIKGLFGALSPKRIFSGK